MRGHQHKADKRYDMTFPQQHTGPPVTVQKEDKKETKRKRNLEIIIKQKLMP